MALTAKAKVKSKGGLLDIVGTWDNDSLSVNISIEHAHSLQISLIHWFFRMVRFTLSMHILYEYD